MSRKSSSRSHSRIPSRAHSPGSSVPYFPGGADVLVIPGGPVGKPAAELLGNIIHHESEHTLVENMNSGHEPGHKASANNGEPPQVNGDGRNDTIEDDEQEQQEQEERTQRPFYRRPSPWWMLITIPLAAIAMSTTTAPRVEVYTKLACHVLKPEYTVESLGNLNVWIKPKTVPPPSERCGEDPDVQAAVAKLITSG